MPTPNGIDRGQEAKPLVLIHELAALLYAAGLRRSRLSGYGDNSEIARKSADADEWHHNFCSVVHVRFRRDGVREIHATA